MNLWLKLVTRSELVTSDTLTVVNHHSWAAEGWGQLVTLPANFSSLQQPLLVNFDISIW